MRYLVLLALLGVIATSLSACYTVRGAGEDVAAAGGAVARTVDPAPYPTPVPVVVHY
ncbi:MAG: hypothetical protein K2W92_10085 [Alphaproteobacteria bacterium]|nr:hypothetical protein [Alphaproteobacteria bacterium]